jgi:hypothetical protein
MKFKTKSVVLTLLVTCVSLTLKSQSVINISGTKVVAGGEVFKVTAGSTLVFEPGAILSVEGGIELNGTLESPITIISKDSENPGRGIQINGWDQQSNIKISNVKIDGLVQSLRFDPFWYRRSVNLNDIEIKNSSSGEPVIYVGSPTIDLSNSSNKVLFNIKGLNLVNNNSGILLESFNSLGLIYDLDKLLFADNYIDGSDESRGILTLNFENGSTTTTSRIGQVVLFRNFAGNTTLGVAVAGSSSQTATIETLFTNDSQRLVYDQSKDPRIPLVNTPFIGDLKMFNTSNNYIRSIAHVFGTVKTVPNANSQLVELRDSSNRLVEFNLVRVGDTQMYHYIQGLPAWGFTNNGAKIRIPEVVASEVSNIYVTKIDTGEYYDYLRKKKDEEKFYATHLVLDKYLTLPVIKRKGEILEKQKTWELGIWGGGSIYGGGDLKHKFAPVPSTIEYSRGLYAQINLNQRFSVKLNGYYSSISMHNIFAPGVFSGMKPPVVYNKNKFGDDIRIFKNITWPINFYTRMYILEGEALWHMKENKIKPGKKYAIIPTLGLSFGVLHYTPYRFTYTEKMENENYFTFRNRLYSDHMYNLRKVGSEGQNFLPGAKPYGSIALNLGSSFSLALKLKKWSFKGEMKVAYTSTDYLDDFGPGYWYGGDLEAVRDNIQIDGISQGIKNLLTPTDSKLAEYSIRSTNGLNDWYYQAHLGVSYDITGFSFKKKK